MKNMTYAQALEIAIASVDNTEAKERLEALMASIVKKNTADRKPTKTQVENDAVRQEILAVLSDGQARTIAEITEAVPALHDATSQRVSALLTPLMKSEKVVREMVKRKAYFKLA